MTPAREAVGLASEFQPELASVTELPGVGHMLMSEAPGQVRRILFEAATSTAGPGPRGRLGVDSG
jgi:pimeloyl-ACP methyl ester carboxylesterase